VTPYHWHAFRRTFRLWLPVTAKGGTTLQSLTYGYDAGGNVTAVTMTRIRTYPLAGAWRLNRQVAKGQRWNQSCLVVDS
jgi:YD repeat-containing protein